MAPDDAFASLVDAQDRRVLVHHLVAARIRLGLSQREVAKRLGVGQSTVSRFEHCEDEQYLWTIQRYARAIGQRLSFEIVPK